MIDLTIPLLPLTNLNRLAESTSHSTSKYIWLHKSKNLVG